MSETNASTQSGYDKAAGTKAEEDLKFKTNSKKPNEPTVTVDENFVEQASSNFVDTASEIGKQEPFEGEGKAEQMTNDVQPKPSGKPGTVFSSPCASENPSVNIDEEQIGNRENRDIEDLDRGISAKIAQQSEEGYRKLSEKIVDIVDSYLSDQKGAKIPLRDTFSGFFKALLWVQYIFLLVFIFLDSLCCVPFHMSESLIRTFIVSVFLETLGAISVMLAFAFSTKEETTIVQVLTTVIEHYQKYQEAGSNKKKKLK